MTEQAAQLHHDNAPVHSTAVVQAFFGKASHHPGLSAPPQPRFGSLRLLAFPKAKIAVEREEICECDGQTEHKVGQRCLTTEWLAPRDSDCSWMQSKVSSDWLSSYIKVTLLVLEIIKVAGYFPDRPRMWNWNRLRNILHDAEDAHKKYFLDSHTIVLSNISECLAMKVIPHVATTHHTPQHMLPLGIKNTYLLWVINFNYLYIST
jgi:hypothetical protein